MNRIERVYKAIRHQPGAGIPTGELTMDRAFMEALLMWKCRCTAAKTMTMIELLIECAHLLDHDVVCLPSAVAHGSDNVPAAAIDRIAAAGFFVFWIEDGAFQRTLQRHDFMAFMQAVAGQPEAAAAEITKASPTVVENIRQAVALGAHGILLAEDIAYQHSTYVSPTFGNRHLVPLWRDQTEAAAAAGAPIFFHSDGNLNQFLPLIVAAGFDGLQGIEPAASMDIFTIRQTHGRDLCLMGNLDPALLCDPSVDKGSGEEALDQAVSDLLQAFQESGGLILGTCSGLHAGMSPQRVWRMTEGIQALTQSGN